MNKSWCSAAFQKANVVRENLLTPVRRILFGREGLFSCKISNTFKSEILADFWTQNRICSIISSGVTAMSIGISGEKKFSHFYTNLKVEQIFPKWSTKLCLRWLAACAVFSKWSTKKFEMTMNLSCPIWLVMSHVGCACHMNARRYRIHFKFIEKTHSGKIRVYIVLWCLATNP